MDLPSYLLGITTGAVLTAIVLDYIEYRRIKRRIGRR